MTETPKMIEKVMDAIRKPVMDDEPLANIARAAIEAMREPTEEMLKASNREWDGRMSHRSSGAWQAMIDAALKATDGERGVSSEEGYMEGPTAEMERDHLAEQCNTLLRENEQLRAAIRKYLAHQVSHQESYRMFNEAIGRLP